MMQSSGKKFTLFVLVWMLSFKLFGQFGQEKVLTKCEICGLQSLQALDLDKDGNQDIVGTTNFDDALFWLKNNGNANFSAPTILNSKFRGIVDGQWIDFDKDGDLDFIGAASANSVANDAKHFIWIKNLGGGKFSDPGFLINSNISLDKLFLGDIDGDQDPDVVAQASNLNQVFVYKNEGNGLIQSVNSVFVAQDVKIIGLLDFDQDKDLDILVHFYNQVNWEIAFLSNVGLGQFTLQRPSLRESLNFISYADFLDLNKDNLPDLVYTTPGSLLIQMNAGNGKLQSFTLVRTISGGESVKLVKYADIDKDNDIDILMVVNKNSVSEFDFRSDIIWLQNDGNGNFFYPPTRVLLTAPANIVRFDLADFDKDQDLDILYGISGLDGILLGVNNGANAYSVSTIKIAEHGWITSISTEDMDGDRQKDIVATSALDGKLTWYKNLGNHQFSAQKNISSALLGAKLATPVDLDGDNIKDLFTYYQLPDSRLSWYKNLGNGVFSNELMIYKNPNDYLSADIVAADLDQDGDNDIVTKLKSNQVLAWCQNNGKGEFTAPQQIEDLQNLFSYANGLEVGDLDGDKLPEIVTVAYPGHLVWYKNKGGGTFSTSIRVNVNTNNLPGSISNYRLVDIDRDQDKDIVVVVAYHLFLLFENDGTGKFVEKQLINDLEEPTILDLKTEDIDGDGDMDILAGTENYGDLVIWYQNDGKQHFTKQTIYPGKGLRTLVTTGDLDNDGDSEVIFAERQFNKIAWYENLGSTTSTCFLQHKLKHEVLPNPFSETFRLHIDEYSEVDKGMFQLYNGQGQVVYNKTLNGGTSITVEPGILPAGVYFYSIRDRQGNVRGTGKLLHR